MKIKRDPLDDIFSKCVRERANWTCERCGKYFEEGRRMGLHCSHYVGRANKALRWYPGNANAHCYGCHSYFEQNPQEFYRWFCGFWGEGAEQIITEKARVLTKWPKWKKEEAKKHYRKELQRMEQARAEGETGWIDFEGYE